MPEKARLLYQGTPRLKYTIPTLVIANGILNQVKPKVYPIIMEMTVSDIGTEVDHYLKRYLSTTLLGSQTVRTRIYKEVHEHIHQLLKDQGPVEQGQQQKPENNEQS